MKWVLPAVLLAVCLSACAPVTPADPDAAIAQLKAACNAACAATAASAVAIPAGWSLSADPDGLCLTKGTRLLCGTCGCDTYGLAPEQLVPASDADRAVTCRFSGDAQARTFVAACD